MNNPNDKPPRDRRIVDPVPTAAEIAEMWKRLVVRPLNMNEPAIHNVVDGFRSNNVNGGAEFACFQLSEEPELKWFASRNRFYCGLDSRGQQLDFFSTFLTRADVRSALPMFEIGEELQAPLNLDRSEAFTLDGQLARSLVFGGAYKNFRGRGPDAKVLGIEFCRTLFGDRYEDILVYTSGGEWSTWFKTIGVWNNVWFGYDKALLRCWILAITDETNYRSKSDARNAT